MARTIAISTELEESIFRRSLLLRLEIFQIRRLLALLGGHDGAVAADVIDLVADGDPGLTLRTIVLRPGHVGDPLVALRHRPRSRQRAVGRGHLVAKELWIVLVE